MPDIQKLITTLLSDGRLAGNSRYTSKVYRDEPILLTAAELERRRAPARYREMRKIARRGGIYAASGAKVFYEQAVFMEDFEDDFAYLGEFAHYFPTYESMTDLQLRGYFSWRTRVRRGVIEKTPLSFVFVYLYELLHGIGTRCAEEGFHALKNFRAAYEKIDPRIARHAALWLRDYVVYNDLDKTLLEDVPDAHPDRAADPPPDRAACGSAETFAALRALSSYNFERSAFFKQHADDVRQVVHGVFSALSEYYAEDSPNGLYGKFFGRMYSEPYVMFRSAVFYDRLRRSDFVYTISDRHIFRCANGNWSRERFFRDKGKNRRIGDLLRAIDCRMREHYRFRPLLQGGDVAAPVRDIIEQEIITCLERKKKAALPKIDIDVSRLQDIRDASLEIQKKLLVEAPEEDNAPKTAGDADARSGGAELNDNERLFVRCLLRGAAYDDLARAAGVMPSLLIDAINEKFFDVFGDTVIAEAGGKAELIEDYRAELEAMLGE